MICSKIINFCSVVSFLSFSSLTLLNLSFPKSFNLSLFTKLLILLLFFEIAFSVTILEALLTVVNPATFFLEELATWVFSYADLFTLGYLIGLMSSGLFGLWPTNDLFWPSFISAKLNEHSSLTSSLLSTKNSWLRLKL